MTTTLVARARGGGSAMGRGMWPGNLGQIALPKPA